MTTRSLFMEQALSTTRGGYAREDLDVALTSHLFRLWGHAEPLASHLLWSFPAQLLPAFVLTALVVSSTLSGDVSVAGILGPSFLFFHPLMKDSQSLGIGGPRKTPVQLAKEAQELVHAKNPSAEDLRQSIILNGEVLAREKEITDYRDGVVVRAFLDMAKAYRKLGKKEKDYDYLKRAWDRAQEVEINFLDRLLLWDFWVKKLTDQNQLERADEVIALAFDTFNEIYGKNQRPKGQDNAIPEKDFRFLMATKNQKNRLGILTGPRSTAAKFLTYFSDYRDLIRSKRGQGNSSPEKSLLDLLTEVDQIIAQKDASEDQRQRAVQWCALVLERIEEITKREQRTRIYFVTLQKQAYVLTQGKHLAAAKQILERSLQEGEKEEVPLDVRLDTWQLGFWIYDHLKETESLLKLAKLYQSAVRDIQRRIPPHGRGLYIPERHREAIKRPGAQTADVKAKLVQAETFLTKIVEPYLAAQRASNKAQVATPPASARPVERVKKPAPAPAPENGGVGKKTAWKQSWDLYRARQFDVALDHLQMARDYGEVPFLSQLTRAQMAIEEKQADTARAYLAVPLQDMVLKADPSIRMVASKDPLSELLSVVTRRNFASRWAQKPAESEMAVEVLLAARDSYRSEGDTNKANQVLSLARVAAGVHPVLKTRIESIVQSEQKPEMRAESRRVLSAEDLQRLVAHFPKGFELPDKGYHDLMEWLLTHRFLDRSWAELVELYGPIEDFHDLLARFVLFEVLPQVDKTHRVEMASAFDSFEGGIRPFRLVFELEYVLRRFRNVPLTAAELDHIESVFISPETDNLNVVQALQHEFQEIAAKRTSETGLTKDLGVYMISTALGYPLGGPWAAMAIALGGGLLIVLSISRTTSSRAATWFKQAA